MVQNVSQQNKSEQNLLIINPPNYVSKASSSHTVNIETYSIKSIPLPHPSRPPSPSKQGYSVPFIKEQNFINEK